jgi:alpha-galactosidase
LPILFDEERGVWALQGKVSTYGFGVDGEGSLQHLYHGAALLRLEDLPEPGWPEAPQGRQQEVWVRHVWGVYELLQRLRERHPGVAFETCASGGGRIDLGMFRFTDQAWVSDNTDPYDRLFIQEGFSMAYPARVMMCWVADPGKWVRGRHASVSYRFHSSMMGSLGIGVNLTQWSEKEMEEARELVEKYKEIRPAPSTEPRPRKGR